MSTARASYVASMRRVLTFVIRSAALSAGIAVVRKVLLDRSPQQGLKKGEPVIGSLDTWPDVPRRPAQ
jgi:hypothetical protein